MIVPMKKICIVVQDKYRNEAMIKLREFGVMHVERTDAVSDRLSKALERKANGEDAIGLIQPYKAPKKKKGSKDEGGRERRTDQGERRGRRATDKGGLSELEPYSLSAINAAVRPDLINLMNGMGSDRKTLEEKVAALAWEQGRIASWGEFDPQDLKTLASRGLAFYLYEFSHEIFKTIPKETRYIKLAEGKETIRLLVLDNQIPNVSPFQVPEKSLTELNADLASQRKRLAELEARIKSFANRRPVLAKDMAVIDSNVGFEEVLAELKDTGEGVGNSGLSFLQGYIPAEDMKKLKAAATENAWAFAADDPGQDDPAPTKLKNNAAVQLITPITGFLDLLPGYHEVDVSSWFLLFFTIFFGMIFGDAGYGLLLLIMAIVGIFKTAKNGVPVPLRMLLLLSISNTVWGTLTCTWFGIDTAILPQFLRDISFTHFSTVKGTDPAIVNQNLQVFCFSLALLHLGIARIIGFIRGLRKRNLRLFADLGSLGMLIGMYNVVLFLVVSNEQRAFPMLPISLYLLAGGFLLNFIFGYYEGSIVQSILDSLKNIISVILGISGVFSDIMSYIRLWAVGLAGASLAATFNGLAGPLLGNFLVFFGIIILTFGHGLNLALNVLSVLVHGVRLNILEFSGHVGLTWAGVAYKPFTETVKK